jgi:broad specificity phosphatase PhoE/ribonuclease HI
VTDDRASDDRAAGDLVAVDRVIVEADGGARGNPGPAGYGALVRDPDSGEVLAERHGFLGVATNNVAEYSGLVAGLKAAAELGATRVEVRMDSKLVVEQMTGRWQIKHPALRPLAAQAASEVARFDTVRFSWIPRERNRDADALANQAMDAAAGVERAAPVPARSWEPPSTTPTRLILLRHGATELTAQRRYSGRGDPPLSALGQAQARAAAERIAAMGVEIAAVLSSPLRRCTATAAPLGVPVTVDDDLVECDFGEWEGRTFAEVRERWPAEMEKWLSSPAVAPPGGESFRRVTSRVRRFVARVRDRYPAATVVAVSHVTPIKLALRDALAAGDDFLHRLYLDPAGISTIDLYPDDAIAVRTVNDTAHLTTLPPAR